MPNKQPDELTNTQVRALRMAYARILASSAQRKAKTEEERKDQTAVR